MLTISYESFCGAGCLAGNKPFDRVANLDHDLDPEITQRNFYHCRIYFYFIYYEIVRNKKTNESKMRRIRAFV